MNETLAQILRRRIIAVIRSDRMFDPIPVVDILAAGGVDVIEVTLTSPGAVETIASLAAHRPDLCIGAGSVIDATLVSLVAEAGAAFYASPVLDVPSIDRAHSLGLLAIPGCATPSEMIMAKRAGAQIVKLFPMPQEPASYIRSILAPLPSLRIAPSGGIDDTNAATLLEAGAATLNVGSWLTPGCREGVPDLEEIGKRVRRLIVAVASASARRPTTSAE